MASCSRTDVGSRQNSRFRLHEIWVKDTASVKTAQTEKKKRLKGSVVKHYKIDGDGTGPVAISLVDIRMGKQWRIKIQSNLGTSERCF